MSHTHSAVAARRTPHAARRRQRATPSGTAKHATTRHDTPRHHTSRQDAPEHHTTYITHGVEQRVATMSVCVRLGASAVHRQRTRLCCVLDRAKDNCQTNVLEARQKAVRCKMVGCPSLRFCAADDDAVTQTRKRGFGELNCGDDVLQNTAVSPFQLHDS